MSAAAITVSALGDRFALVSAPFWGETPPATPVSPSAAEAIAREVFGIDGTATPLGSNQETNLRIRAAQRSYVLKVDGRASSYVTGSCVSSSPYRRVAVRRPRDMPVPVTAPATSPRAGVRPQAPVSPGL